MSLTQGKCRVYTSERTKLKHVVRELKDNIFEPEESQEIVKAVGFRSNYLVDVKTTSGAKYLVSIPSKFRNKIWIQKGQYIIVEPIAEGKKVKAEVIHVLFPDHVQHLQSKSLWPEAFNPPFQCRYKEIRAGIDEKLKEVRKVEAEETSGAAVCRSASGPESEEDDESDLFVNVNRHYLHGAPVVHDASDDDSEEDDSEEEEEEDSEADDDSKQCEESKEEENTAGASADTAVANDRQSAAESSPAVE